MAIKSPAGPFSRDPGGINGGVHAKRLKARQLAHAGNFDSALLMLELARDFVRDLGDDFCAVDALLQDINTTEWYVNRLRRPATIAEEILAGGAQ